MYKCFDSKLNAPMSSLDHLQQDSFSLQIFISHPANLFQLKGSWIINVSSWGQKHNRGEFFFGLKSITCILSNVNPLLNYVVIPTILIFIMLPINKQFYVKSSKSKFLVFLNISGNRKKFSIILNIILD